jgi:predicted metal-dependent hydrolase
MTTVGQIEKKTQGRVVALFRDRLGYDYRGDWTDREAMRALLEPVQAPYDSAAHLHYFCAKESGNLRALIPPLLTKWQAKLGVELADWGIKKMKTKWVLATVLHAASG